jgi:DNA-directed RNA polymerase alpha subunit
VKNKITVERVGDVYIVSDDGAICRAMYVQPVTPWQLVAKTSEEVGVCVKQMETLITGWENRAERVQELMVKIYGVPQPKDQSGGTTEKPRIGSDGPLKDLGLAAHHLWRLKKATGVESIGQLCGLEESFLAAQRGVGPAMIRGIKKALKKRGLRLAAKVGKTG